MQTGHGSLCDPIAFALRLLTESNAALRVYQDHAGLDRQRLWAHLDGEPHRWNILSGVDVLLADADSGEAVLVLEIEETACSPKKLLGDIMALSLCEYLTTESDNRRYAVTPKTELWVCFPANPRGHQRVRNERLLDRLQTVLGGTLPPENIRLVLANNRDSLVDAVRDALRRWVDARACDERGP
jgi:hypothetical protein